MKKTFWTVPIVLVSLVGSAAFAAEPAKTEKAPAAPAAKVAPPEKKVVASDESEEMINRATCTHGKDTRDLEIVAKGTGHVVSYTHGGETKEVGTCSSNKDKCQKVFDNIKSNLEKSGYTCS